jgi:hypothetical protein
VDELNVVGETEVGVLSRFDADRDAPPSPRPARTMGTVGHFSVVVLSVKSF